MATSAVQNVSRPEYMNATPHHAKDVTGKMEMECRADKGVGIGFIMVELFAIQELNSRDHSASSTFLHTRRLFQGPGLPPSNAVDAYPSPGQPPLPQGYFPARRGVTTFFFQFPIPLSSPSSISFASGLAKLRYEVRASVGVAHKGEKRVVTDHIEADIVQCQDMEGVAAEHVVVGEGGKVYVQGRIVGGRIVSGQRACIELRVRNHSSKKTTGLTLALSRLLHLHDTTAASRAPLQLSDTLFTQAFRGSEYSMQPGSEGVANLVFDVPKAARVVKGGIRDGADDDEGGRRRTEPLFEVRCILNIKIGMGIGSKDIVFEMPVQLNHPTALPPAESYVSAPIDVFHNSPSPRPVSPPFEPPNPYFAHSGGPSSPSLPFASPPLSASPPPNGYHHPASPIPTHGYPAPFPQPLWSPPPPTASPLPYLSPDQHQMYYFPPPPVSLIPFAYPARPSSANAGIVQNVSTTPSGLPSGLPGVGGPMGHVYHTFQQQHPQPTSQLHGKTQDAHPPEDLQTEPVPAANAEVGKGERASRISHHLHVSKRARSASPTSHRFPGPSAATSPPVLHMTAPRKQAAPSVLSPRPMLSPRTSFSHTEVPSKGTVDDGGTARSERVDMLERMVDPAPGEESKSVEEVLRDLERVEAEKKSDKTLPKPPVPSGKPQPQRKSSGMPRASDVFALQMVKEKNETSIAEEHFKPAKSVLRPSPMARRVSNDTKDSGNERTNGGDSLHPEPLQYLNGLDALERRLLYEVGTRKPDKPDRPTILPLATTSQPAGHTAPNDSDISSLALASNGSIQLHPQHSQGDVNKAIVSASPPSNDEQKDAPKSRMPVSADDKDRLSTTPEAVIKNQDHPSTAKAREHEAFRLRKAAKGRVADWLGGLSTPTSEQTRYSDPEIPPKMVSVSTQRNASGLSDGTKASENKRTTPSPTPDPKSVEAPAKPNCTENLQSISPGVPEHSSPELQALQAEEAKSLDFRPGPSNSAVNLSPSTQPIPSSSGVIQRTTLPSEPNHTSTRLPKFPAVKLAPDTKYDIRSARGGKGGITTSVAALWQSRTEEQDNGKPNTPSNKPATRITDKRPPTLDTGKRKAGPTWTNSPLNHTAVSSASPSVPESSRPRNMVKSASVPAAVVSSHARPHLSSTASLARPAPLVSKSKPPSLSPTLSESQSREPTPKVPVSAGEMAFGQARLKELIKKYQQGAP